MAKSLSKSQIAAALAEKAGTTKKQAVITLETLAELVYKNAKNSIVIPGVGKVVLANRPARKMIMRFGPKAGQEITVKAKQVLRFRFAKIAKDKILKK
jgi:DNA-binding protein HU-beta